MSQTQINATLLLCRLLEQSKPEANGAGLLSADLGGGAHDLIRERLLVIGPSLSYVTCPECGVATARVLREIGREQILLYCDECGELATGIELRRTYKVHFATFIRQLMIGLETLPSAVKEIELERIWRLGTTEHVRGKPQTWYFARHLHNHNLARRLLEQIREDKASSSAKILTTSETPVPEGSPLVGFDVINLGAAGRISQSKFQFFTDRMSSSTGPVVQEPRDRTTLRFVRTQGLARVDAIDYRLAPSEKAILLALIDDYDHTMDLESLRVACKSQSVSFSPSKVFERHPEVYKVFLMYQSFDNAYILQIPNEDRDWLT